MNDAPDNSGKTCRYLPEEFAVWYDENDVEHEETTQAEYEYGTNGVCSECGNVMLGDECGWFSWSQDTKTRFWVMKPRFRFCPHCGARVLGSV